MIQFLKSYQYHMLGLGVLLATAGCGNDGHSQTAKPENNFDSVVISKESAAIDNQAWGAFFTYFQGQTLSVDDVLMGVAEIKPGQEIHPPHTHPEEEFLMVIEGTGEWHLNGKNFPANAGDVLYAKPGEIHGVKNTGETFMKFVVWKWSAKQ